MSLILATGSNLGNKLNNLNEVKSFLCQKFNFIAESRVYSSAAVEYEDQPDFYNQVLEFETPIDMNPSEVMSFILSLEYKVGRRRDIPKGPRVIDVDILFFDLLSSNDKNVLLPHPRLFERSFVVKPLSELPYYQILKEHFNFKFKFDNSAEPI